MPWDFALKIQVRERPGHPVVSMLCFHCRKAWVSSLVTHMVWPRTKTNKQTKQKTGYKPSEKFFNMDLKDLVELGI